MTSTPQDALVVTTAFAPRGGYRSTFATLARLESWRLARHPVLLVGTAVGMASTASALTEAPEEVAANALGMPVVALTVGLTAMLSAYHLTRSFHRADELLEASPILTTTRTMALCVTAVVPALIASLWLIFYYGFAPAALDVPEWMYGTLSHADLAAVLVGNSVVAAIGGTVLGVAAGRWWRFRGASAVLVLGVGLWTMVTLGAFSSGDAAPAGWVRWVRLFTPVGYFSSPSAHSTFVMTLTGSPWWYFAWLLTLCALAVVAALLWRAEGATRRQIVRVGAVALVLSAVTYGFAASGGLSHQIRSFPDGHSVVMMPK
ncbi:MAG: hypothetical protein ABI336_07680 [Humibacillus sp.]